MEETLTETKVCVITKPTAFAMTVQVLSCLVVLFAVMCVAFSYDNIGHFGGNYMLAAIQVQTIRLLDLYLNFTELAFAIILITNAVIYSLLFRFAKKAVAYPSCAFVILCQAVIAALVYSC